MRTEYDKEVRDATLKAILSGGLSGAAFGGGAGLLAGKDPILGALAGGLGGATLAGGSTYLGTKLVGPPDNRDPSTYTKRAAVGGAVGGGTLGALMGGVAGGTKLGEKMVPKFAKDYATSLRSMKGGKGAVIGAALGALGLGAFSGYKGADEGMQLDFVNNQIEQEKKQRLREAYGL